VVPSPRPKRIVELRSIKLLADDGVLVICAGGGGVPVIELPHMGVEGVDAVITKVETVGSHFGEQLPDERSRLLAEDGFVGRPLAVEARIGRRAPAVDDVERGVTRSRLLDRPGECGASTG
jgi:carbamate kinase